MYYKTSGATMTDKQKQFIENNIDLIEQESWEEFFRACPPGTGYFLHESGINFLQDVNYIKEGMFATSDIENLVIPENIDLVFANSFSNCPKLKHIELSVPVKIYDSFKNCPSFDTIVIPDITVWVYSEISPAFRTPINLVSDGNIIYDIEIPQNILRIKNSCFCSCKSIESLTLPSSVQEVGAYSFAGCVNLKNITILNPDIKLRGLCFGSMDENVLIKFSGTKEQWKNACDKDAFYLTYYTVQCTDGKLTKRKR